MSERPIDDVLREAREIAAAPKDGAADATFFVPALVCESIEAVDPVRVCLTIYRGHPVIIWPKGLRPSLQKEAL